jgi:hypothetical protein
MSAGHNNKEEAGKRPAAEPGSNPPIKRVNFNLPESAVAEATAAAKKKGWNLTQFFLFALAVAVRILDETSSGGQVVLRSSNGEVRELLIPKW